MKRFLLFILPWFMAACGAASPGRTASPTVANSQEDTQAASFSATKLFALTAEVETASASTLENEATVTAILASKQAGGTAMAETMTALPSETPVPTVPPDAPFCNPSDLQTSFASNAATQAILLSAGLTNTGSQACFLQAWPDVALVDQQGAPLEVEYGYFDAGLGAPGAAATQRAQESTTAKVGLLPGWSVWVNLIWQNWCEAPVSGGVVIRLSFQTTGVVSVPTDIPAGGPCNAEGQRSYVGVAELVLIPGP